MRKVICCLLTAAIGEVAFASPNTSASTDQMASPIATRSNTDALDPTVIIGQRPNVTQKIDRRVYTVPTDAKSASSDGYALLRGLPAVTIGVEDKILLLGSAHVTILVDSKPPADITQVLRTLRGADIDHIEVMTNPSAEYAPDGTGGIINFVLKKKHLQAVSGTFIAQVDSFCGNELDFTQNLLTGPWSFDTRLDYRRVQRQASYTMLRDVETVAGGPPTSNKQNTDWRNTSHFVLLDETVGYKIDPRSTLDLNAYAYSDRVPTNAATNYVGLTPDFLSFDEQSVESRRLNAGGGSLSFDREGKSQGEALKILLSYDLTDDRDTQNQLLTFQAPASIARYSNSSYQKQDEFNLKLDVTHPMDGARILSYGLNDDLLRTHQDQAFYNVSAIAELGPSYADAIAGTRNTAAIYGSFQQPVGKWIFLPALRFEVADFTGAPVSLASFRIHDAAFYPSLHLSRPLGKWIDMILSYSRRTDRPSIDQLNPFTVLISTTSVSAGNPSLRNQTTDAYEVNFSYQRASFTASMILYDRETVGVWNTLYSVTPTGLTETQPSNLGHKADRGAEFDIDKPLAKGLKIVASVNLFDSRVPIGGVTGAASIDQFRTTGNVSLGWSATTKSGRAGDALRIQLSYESAKREYQIAYHPMLSGNFTWSHPLTKGLSAVLVVDNVFGVPHDRHYVNAPLTQETYDGRTIRPSFTFKVVENFGH